MITLSVEIQNFTKPEDLCYPTKENDKDNIIIVEHVISIKLYKEVLKLEFREGICQVL